MTIKRQESTPSSSPLASALAPLTRPRPTIPIPAVKLSDRVTRILASRIIEAATHEDSYLVLPTEQEICDEFEVSKTVAREVVAHLSSMKLVRIRHGRRMELLPESEWNFLHPLMAEVHDDAGTRRLVSELFGFRLLVEPEAAARAAEVATDAQRERMGVLLDALRASVESPEAYLDYDVAFHREVVAASNNRLLAHILDSVRDLMRTSRRVTNTAPDARTQVIEGHAAVYEAILERDPERARTAMRAHLQWGADHTFDLPAPESDGHAH